MRTEDNAPDTYRIHQIGPMRNWKDGIELDCTVRDIYRRRLKLSPITEDQLNELQEMGLVEVMHDQVN